jgi:flagellar M-ring protein FliF
MQWLKNWMAQIREFLAKLTTSQKLLIGTLSVVILAALIMVALYAGRADMAPLIDRGLTPEQRTAVVDYLQTRGIPYDVEGDRVLVPQGRRVDVMAALQARQLVEDDAANFATLVEKQSWWQSNEQNRQMYTIALQSELAAAIEEMRGVEHAKVIISHPKVRGFGRTHHRPTASVNVTMRSGALNQKKADAIAALISGAVAEMAVKDVAVIDAVAGRQFRPRDEQQMMPTDLLELVQTQERIYRDKIASALSYMPDVIVAVNVSIDAAQRSIDQRTYSEDDSVSLITREHSREEETSEKRDGGEPGVRSNTGMDIAGAGGTGRQSSLTERESEFQPHAGVKHEKIINPGGMPEQISATVNVPRSYFVSLFMRGKADDAPPPSDADLMPIVEDHLKRIKQQVQPLVSTRAPGQVVVDVYPDDRGGIAAAGVSAAADRGPMGLLDDGVGRMIAPLVLALVAVVAMFLMIRKANQPTPIPDAAELAGLPPMLGDGEAEGEAAEDESALDGMELDEEQYQMRQLNEQVAELVRNKPEEAATLLKMWIRDRS